MKRLILSALCIMLSFTGFSQEKNVLSFSEFLGYVKKHHPVVKQANLILKESEAKLLKARGSFDPKLEVDYDKKQFKNTEYFNKLNTTFKVPTWYGVELKGSFEENSGTYLNPESTVPNEGLYNVGISVSLAKGLLINERMAALKQAKVFQQQAKADNKLLVNEIIYKAIESYFTWIKNFQEKEVFEEFLNNAELRLQGIKRSYELGEKPAIDTTEAKILYNNRKLSLEKAKLNYAKATLQISNYLWINNTPVELQENIIPDVKVINYIDTALQLNNASFELNENTHPKIASLNYKIKSLEINRRLKQNNLLPKIDLQYNFLSKTPQIINSFNTANYKVALGVSIPLFLRKERADLKLANYKLQDINFEKQVTSLSLKNKLSAIYQEINSYKNQISIAKNIVADYSILLKGEERKFEIGESSLFLINSRESKLIENKIKAITLENSLLKSKAQLFNTLGI